MSVLGHLFVGPHTDQTGLGKPLEDGEMNQTAPFFSPDTGFEI